MWLWIKGILFTILVPGTVAGYIPNLLMRDKIPDINLGIFHWTGLLFIITGILIYLSTAFSFLARGKGTPAVWFTKAISFMIGEEPVKMVSSGFYKYSRNPMYIGVLMTVIGQGLYLQYSNVLWYALLVFIIFNFVIVFIEEPHLEEKFGDEYRDYKKKTRRWI